MARLQEILRNDYYTGIVRNGGKPYKGRHEPLVSTKVFEEVQAVLSTKRLSGERDRKHAHYLKGSLYCDECGRRLMFSRNKGNGGAYEYFICRDRQLGKCSRPHRGVEAVEQAVVRHYMTIRLSDERRRSIRAAIQKRFEDLMGMSARELELGGFEPPTSRVMSRLWTGTWALEGADWIRLRGRHEPLRGARRGQRQRRPGGASSSSLALAAASSSGAPPRRAPLATSALSSPFPRLGHRDVVRLRKRAVR